MHPLQRAAWLGMALFLSACSSLLAPNVQTELTKLKGGDYQLDPAHFSLIFKVKHLGLSTYVGRFNEAQARLSFDPKALENTKLSGIVNMTSVDANNPKLESTLAGSTWFDSVRYPQAVFTTLRGKQITSNQFELEGELTWRGETRTIALLTEFHGGANNMLTGKYTVGFSASTSFLRSDFGMNSYSGLIGDEIIIEIEGEFQRTSPSIH